MRFVLLFLLPLCSVGQDAPNWAYHQTKISIDTSFILKRKITLHGSTFNYKRLHDSTLVEYGNIRNGKPNGKWVYRLNNFHPSSEEPIAIGRAKEGYKVGKWKHKRCVCEGMCYCIYKWDREKKESKKTNCRICVE